jgi:hypothetical protein
MVFGRKRLSRNFNFNIEIDGAKIDQVKSTKFLGVFIDDKLSWNSHILKLTKKIAINISILKNICYKISLETSLMLYYAIIQSHLVYCTIVWGGTSGKNINTLLKLQKKAIRIITKSHYIEHSDPLFKKLKILKISDLYKLQICTYTHKHINFSSSNPIPNSFLSLQEINHSHATRHSAHRLKIMTCHSEVRRKSINIAAPRSWNSLPVDLRLLTSAYEFKRNLMSYMISHYDV